jgi:DNA-binding LacI/PurR family transcriptional regulator
VGDFEDTAQTRGRPTLADVAAHAGVSRTTVSNAYNRPDQLSAARRELVLAAAAELGYSGPDPMARSLRTRSADAVGLIFSANLSVAFSDPAAVEFLHGVAQACEERDRSLLLIPAGPPAANIAMVSRAAVDGFLIYSMPNDAHVEAVLARPQPAVIVDSPTDIADVDYVGIDDRGGFRSVCAHVLELGHRRLAIVSHGPDEYDPTAEFELSHAVFRERMLGLRAAVAAVPDAVDIQVRTGPTSSHDVGRAQTAALMDSAVTPTAIICTSDALAFGVLAELTERGVRVPGQVSVTGFDDVAAAADRGLTSVWQPTHEKGHLAALMLLDRAASDQAGAVQRRILPTRLVVRASSGPPPD